MKAIRPAQPFAEMNPTRIRKLKARVGRALINEASVHEKLDVILAELKDIRRQTQPVTYNPRFGENAKELRGQG